MEQSPVCFDNYAICPDSNIVRIDEKGITLSADRFISFAECARNFRLEKGGGKTCVGERDVTDLSFAFYTAPHPTVIKFFPKGKLPLPFAKTKTTSRFLLLQKQIEKYGYSTYDMS